MTQGILEFPRAEILGSSWGMTKNASRGMTQGLGILDGILNEIASAFLKPRNDGILEFLEKNHISHCCELFSIFSLITEMPPAMLNSQAPWTLTQRKSFSFLSSSVWLGRAKIAVSSSS